MRYSHRWLNESNYGYNARDEEKKYELLRTKALKLAVNANVKQLKSFVYEHIGDFVKVLSVTDDKFKDYMKYIINRSKTGKDLFEKISNITEDSCIIYHWQDERFEDEIYEDARHAFIELVDKVFDYYDPSTPVNITTLIK